MVFVSSIPWWGVLPLVVCLLGSLSCLIYYCVVTFRVVRGRKVLPTAREGLKLPPPENGWPSVAIIIPAHNEADVIARAASTVLQSSYPGSLHAVFALDRCTDETEVILRQTIEEHADSTHSAEVMLITECPDDWAGKVHAIHTGVTQSAQAQRSDLLLFADADTGFDADLVCSTVAILSHRSLSLLSLLSTLTRETWFEKLVQPAAGFELIRQYPLDQVNSPDRGRAFANGQFMLFTREAYEAVGGHAAVRDELLEDLAFARRVKKPGSGRAIGCLEADGMLSCQMYRNWKAFRTGWKRIYTEAARRRPNRLRQNATRMLLTSVAMPAVAVLSILIGAMVLWRMPDTLAIALLAVSVSALLAYMISMGLVYRAQHLGMWRVLTYPVGSLCVAAIMREAAKDLDKGTATEWGGKQYAREVRS